MDVAFEVFVSWNTNGRGAPRFNSRQNNVVIFVKGLQIAKDFDSVFKRIKSKGWETILKIRKIESGFIRRGNTPQRGAKRIM